MHNEMTQKINVVNETLSDYNNRLNQKVTENQNEIQTLSNNAVKSVNNVKPVSGNVTIDTVDNLKVVTDIGQDKGALSSIFAKYGDMIFQSVTSGETIESKKSSSTTLVTKELLDSFIKEIALATTNLNNQIASKGTEIADIKANYATKQWVTDNFTAKLYITNNSSTADSYKAHPDQLVILTK